MANCTWKPLGDVKQIHVRFQKAEKKKTAQIRTDQEGLKCNISSEKVIPLLLEMEYSSHAVQLYCNNRSDFEERLYQKRIGSGEKCH